MKALSMRERRNHFLCLWICLFLIGLTAISCAFPKPHKDLSDPFTLFIAERDSISLESILNNPPTFHPMDKGKLIFPTSREKFDYWIKIDLNNFQKGQDLIFAYKDQYCQQLELYSFTKNQWTVRRTGLNFPFKTRDVNSKYFVFKIDSQTARTAYLRISSMGFFPAKLVLSDVKSYQRFQTNELIFFSAMIAISLGLMFYNFFLFFTLKDTSYLFYILFIGVFVFWDFIVQGFGSIIIFPNKPEQFDWFNSFLGPLSLITHILFTLQFLKTKTFVPRIHKVLIAQIGILAGGFILVFIVPVDTLLHKLHLLNFVTLFDAYVFYVLSFYIITVSLKKGFRPALFFLIAFLAFLSSQIITNLAFNGTIPLSPLVFLIYDYGSILAITLNAILMSIALADRIRLLQVQIQTAQLQAIENLKQADKLKDDFLANTSHELRTPINGIIGIAESLLAGAAGKMTEKMHHNLTLIAHSGRRLTSLVNDVLDFSSIQKNEIILSQRPLNIINLSEIVIQIMTPLADSKGIELKNKITGERPYAFADENRLQQVLMNLLGNAIKFTEEGSVTLSATQHDDWIKFSITDTGIGIPEDKHEAIFNTFEQADGSITRKFGGTGLGLSISKHIIELHGGEISVISDVGQGSTFSFTIPITDEKPNETDEQKDTQLQSIMRDVSFSEVQSQADNDKKPAAGQKEKQSILVVDDEPVNVQVLVNQLELAGYRVITAPSGKEALGKMDDIDFMPDLVILDVMMPEMNGYEVSKSIRAQYPMENLPIIMVTAKNRVNDLVSGLQSGANDYLTKPFLPEEMLARIENLLRMKENVDIQTEFHAIKREIDTAREIHQSLLPIAHPDVDFTDIHDFYRSMEAIGGDYFNYHMAENGDLLVYICDISGHGLSSAMIASMVKLAFIVEIKTSSDPQEILSGVNKALYKQVTGKYLTAAIISINPKTRELKGANAGHVPVIVWKRNLQKILQIESDAFPIGWYEDNEVSSDTVALEPGDRVILYTDCIVEARSPDGEYYSEERFHRFIGDYQNLPPQTFVDMLFNELGAWSQAENKKLHDDFTIIVLDIK